MQSFLYTDIRQNDRKANPHPLQQSATFAESPSTPNFSPSVGQKTLSFSQTQSNASAAGGEGDEDAEGEDDVGEDDEYMGSDDDASGSEDDDPGQDIDGMWINHTEIRNHED